MFVLLAIVLTWRAFRDNDLKLRVLILLAATLIASPYSIRYELAMLSPSLVDALWAGTARGLLIALPLYGLNVLTIVPALVAQCNRCHLAAGEELGALDIGAHRVGFGFDAVHPVLHEVADRHDAA